MNLFFSILSTILYWIVAYAYPVLSGEELAEELICPDSNPLNCYPKLFQPTEDWQIVKDGQIIPIGLDIRLDLENLKREAKLMSVEDSDKNVDFKNHELVVSDSNLDFQSSLQFITQFSSGKLSKSSIDIVLNHLENLIEWSSDIECGTIISSNIQPFLKLSGLYNDDIEKALGLSKVQVIKVKDMVFRILSACFRNNIEAQETLLKYLTNPEDLLAKLVKYDSNTLIMKRKLGLLGSLLSNSVFDEWFNKGGIESQLIILYSKVNDNSIKERIINILQDSTLEKRSDDGNDDDNETSMDSKYAMITQEKLLSQDHLGPESLQILECLEAVKLGNKHAFKATNEFLDWLDRQIKNEKELIQLRKRDGSETESSAVNLERLVELRHQTFGNPLGGRRDFVDEL